MKKMKTMAGCALSALCALCAAPDIVKAATQSAEKSRGEVMATALLNTVMSIAIVFCVLLLISRLIACFKYIHEFEVKLAAKNAVETAPVSEPEPEPAVEEQEDDSELAVVIAAAIAAFEEENETPVPADGLVVRSIKKVNKAKWQNA